MGANKLGNGNKDYEEGYAAGFAAGVKAWFAATSGTNLMRTDPGINVTVPITIASKAEEGSKDFPKVTGEDVNVSQQGSTAVESPTVAVNVGEEKARLATVNGDALDTPRQDCYTMESSVDSVKLEEKSAHSASVTEESTVPRPEHYALESSIEAEKIGVESECLATVTEEDLNLSYPRSHVLGSVTDVVRVEGEGEGEGQHPDSVTEEELGHIAPGCFVRVRSGDTSYWVEIGQIEGATISGMVHPELSTSICVISHDSCEIARFSRNQITALGCDRYCWC